MPWRKVQMLLQKGGLPDSSASDKVGGEVHTDREDNDHTCSAKMLIESAVEQTITLT